MGWSGLSERSGFRARAGALTLLMLASRDEPETVRAALAQLDAAMFDPDFDPEADYSEEDEGDEEEWDEEVDGDWIMERLWDAVVENPRVPLLAPFMRAPPEPGPDTAGELRYVARVLATWLRESPAGPLRIRGEEGMLAIGALAAGWSTTVVHALSGAALTFEELEKATGAVSREALKARITALEDACLVELLEGPAGEVRYAATPWLRHGIGPLVAAARHECRLDSKRSAPPDLLDVGASFRLTLPLIELPAALSGVCRLGVWRRHEGQRMPGCASPMAGAMAHVESGRVVSVDLELDPSAPSWAAGNALDWMETVIDPGAEMVDVGGGARLAEALINGLHEELFGKVPSSPEEPLDD